MPIEFDFSALRGRIIEKYGSYANFAKAVRIPRAALSGRLNNKIQFKPDEIYQISDPCVLDIESELIGKYFFTPKV